MNNFAARLAQLGESRAVDEFHDVLQGRLYYRLTAADGREAQYRALPKILIAALPDGDVEAIRDTRLDAFNDAALALKRVIFRQTESELENPHYHGLLGLFMPEENARTVINESRVSRPEFWVQIQTRDPGL